MAETTRAAKAILPGRTALARAAFAGAWFLACGLASLLIMIWAEARATRSCAVDSSGWIHPRRMCIPFGNLMNYEPEPYLRRWGLGTYPGSAPLEFVSDQASVGAAAEPRINASLLALRYTASASLPLVLAWYKKRGLRDLGGQTGVGSPPLLVRRWVRSSIGSSASPVIYGRTSGFRTTGVALAPGGGSSETFIWIFEEVHHQVEH